MALRRLNLAFQAAIIIVATGFSLTAFSVTARAADAAHAWGTISSPGAELLNSAAMHQEGAESAQIGSLGAGGGGGTLSTGFPAVTSCGTCTTITIQGDNNSISGTSIQSTNQGTVTSNGFFNQ
jgi:hypothetical protein